MGKARKGSERARRIDALFAAGDHGGARRLAAEALADSGAEAEEREGAAALLARTAPERLARFAGAGGVAVAVAIAAWLVLR